MAVTSESGIFCPKIIEASGASYISVWIFHNKCWDSMSWFFLKYYCKTVFFFFMLKIQPLKLHDEQVDSPTSFSFCGILIKEQVCCHGNSKGIGTVEKFLLMLLFLNMLFISVL
jgi:hypothetical protein